VLENFVREVVDSLEARYHGGGLELILVVMFVVLLQSLI